MKKLVLIICSIATSLSSFSQAKFYSNNGIEEVKELSCGMSDVKVTVPIPEEIGNHELVEITIDYYADDESHETDFKHGKEFKTSYLKTKKTIDMWITKNSEPTEDFCAWYPFSGRDCFKLDAPCKADYRNFKTSDLTVRIFGKDVDGYKWVDNKKVPTYKFTKLKSHKIKMNYGEAESKIVSDNKHFEIQKFSANGFSTGITSAEYGNGGDWITAAYSSDHDADDDESNTVIFQIYSLLDGASNAQEADFGGMGGGSAKTSGSNSLEDLKKSVLIKFIRMANTKSTRYLKNMNPSLSWGSFGTVSEELTSDKFKYETKNPSTKFYNKKLNLVAAGLKREKGKIGDLECDILTIEVKDFARRAAAEAKPKMLTLFVGKSDGKIIAGSYFKAGNNPISADEQKFIDHMVSTVKVK